MEEKLYIVTSISNPSGYKSRYKLYHEFKKYLKQFKNVVLCVVELAVGDQEFGVTQYPAEIIDDEVNVAYLLDENLIEVRLRSDQVFWYKENMINIGIEQLPEDAKYIAWVDADVVFLNPNWVQDTIDALKEYPVVQMFGEYINLDSQNHVLNQADGFIKTWIDHRDKLFYAEKCVDNQYTGASKDNKKKVQKGVTGLAWAARRDVLEQLGGLLDWMIVGSSDWYMAYALIGLSEHTNNTFPLYKVFQDKCNAIVNNQVGYVRGCAVHYWHGSKKKRGYDTRWRILFENKFNPEIDLARDKNGLYRLNPEKPNLMAGLIAYFNSRDEDER